MSLKPETCWAQYPRQPEGNSRKLRTGADDPLLPFEIRQAMTAMQGSPFVVPDAENFSIAHDGFAPMG
jgi:hypothetical protein